MQKQIDVNFVGTLRVTKFCLPLLKAGEGEERLRYLRAQCYAFNLILDCTVGRILNVSSIAGLYGYPGLSIYCATKHAVEGASAVLREELRKFKIPVITVQPGDFSKATNLLNNHHKYV